MNTTITLAKGRPNSVSDADGSAVVIHSKADVMSHLPRPYAVSDGGRVWCAAAGFGFAGILDPAPTTSRVTLGPPWAHEIKHDVSG
jgi:hypothetical protein